MLKITGLSSSKENNNDILLQNGLKFTENMIKQYNMPPFSGNVAIFFINIDDHGNGEFSMKCNNTIDEIIELLDVLDFDSSVSKNDKWRDTMKSNVNQGNYITTITYTWPDNENKEHICRTVYAIRWCNRH